MIYSPLGELTKVFFVVVNLCECAALLKNAKNFLFPPGGGVLQREQDHSAPKPSYYVHEKAAFLRRAQTFLFKLVSLKE